MRRKPLFLLVGVVGLSLVLFGAWRWGPLGADQAVPSCGDLAKALPAAVEGSWTLTRSEPKRAASRFVARCEFGFRSSDQAYRGKIVVDLSAGEDAANLRTKAMEGPCYGEAVSVPGGSRYKVTRACSQQINDKIFAGLFVATDERYAHTLAEISSSSMSTEQAVAFANSSAQRVVDRAMTLNASD